MASVTTNQRFGVNSSMAVKVPCRVCSITNITLSGEQTIDGVSVVADDRVLVTGQTDASENGIYDCDTGTWSRAKDWNGSYDIVTGAIVRVTAGTSNSGWWELTTTGTITIGTTSIAFQSLGAISDFSDTTNIANGDGLIGVKRTASNAVATTQHAWHEWQKISAFDFMTSAQIADVIAGTEGEDVTIAITNMFALGQGYHYHFPKGTYSVTDGFNIPSQCIITGDGAKTIIKAASSWAPTPPSITAVTYTPTLSYTPIFYNATSISYVTIRDLYIHGNDEDCYGLWLHENFYTDIDNVIITNTNKRPYTNIRGQVVTHRRCLFYDCNDGLLLTTILSLHLLIVGLRGWLQRGLMIKDNLIHLLKVVLI
jgi:uncharacterized cupin superfamily protein